MKLTVILIAVVLSFLSTAALAGNYEILYDVRNGSGWFGGDDRALSTPRDVGDGQSVLVDADILLESFSFYFASRFDYRESPTGVGHAVTLTLDVRDDAGTILKTVTVDLADTFNFGWVTWTGIDLDVTAGTTLIFTAYLNGAYENHLTSSFGSDTANGYADGSKYNKQGTGDADMALWAGWSADPTWDATFWLQGSTPVPAEATSWGAVKALYTGGE